MLIARIPRLLRRTFRSLTWELPAGEKNVYLTFDDGPTPGITEWALEQLDAHQFRATFFCLGNNVETHPGIYAKILERGHAVGNHSYSHKKGFRTSVRSYVEDVDNAAELIHSDLFRPPYGRILPAQVRALNKNYRIIMWSVLSVDYNAGIPGEQVVRNVLENVRPGSVIVFHDSVKASKNLFAALPGVLEFLHREGYQPKIIT
ncbi:MAG: polysaccharide deacetylase family protein [Bacteroidales bacterium]|nr:polysaccharide deacetylase family protein [Bacteroidales bacterium]MDT8432742.1 polysaccharide deacetylase family protein [Bacteroidales bacterium]